MAAAVSALLLHGCIVPKTPNDERMEVPVPNTSVYGTTTFYPLYRCILQLYSAHYCFCWWVGYSSVANKPGESVVLFGAGRACRVVEQRGVVTPVPVLRG